MSEPTNAAAVANATEAKKPIRRGVSTALGTTNLKFDTRDVQPNGLFLAHLDKVEVSSFVPGEG